MQSARVISVATHSENIQRNESDFVFTIVNVPTKNVLTNNVISNALVTETTTKQALPESC